MEVRSYKAPVNLYVDMNKHNSLVKRKFGENLIRIGTTYINDCLLIIAHELEGDFYAEFSMEYLQEHFIWADGTPIGEIINND